MSNYPRGTGKAGKGKNWDGAKWTELCRAGWTLDQPAPSHLLCTPWAGATLMIHNIVDFGSTEEQMISTGLYMSCPYREYFGCIEL